MSEAPAPRSLICAACGAAFACGPGTGDDGRCWCFAMPLLETPDPQSDCLCQKCLGVLLAERAAPSPSPSAP